MEVVAYDEYFLSNLKEYISSYGDSILILFDFDNLRITKIQQLKDIVYLIAFTEMFLVWKCA